MLTAIEPSYMLSPDDLNPRGDGRENRTVSRTLVIGIGGTGCLAAQWTLWFVRKRFRNHRLPLIEFLVLDTTSEESEISVQLEVGDFVNIAGFNSNWYFRHAKEYPYLRWLPVEEFVPGEINVGAHGKPHIGRLCYFMHREGLIKRAVEGKLDRLTHECLANRLDAVPGAGNLRIEKDAHVTIHLVASVFGGTGAGCLLDMAYDLRQWCEQRTGHPPRIVAHLLLPEAFQLRCSPTIHRQHRATAYAVLSQINQFMGSNAARIQYKVGREVEWPKEVAPFDFCFLLDGPSGKTTTNREAVCCDIGRMIAMLTVEYPGKRIFDRSINLYRGLDLQGSDQAELRTYSSYGLGVGRRPAAQVEDLLEKKTFQALGQLGARGLEDAGVEPGDWFGPMELELFDPERLRRELMQPIKDEVDRLEQEEANEHDPAQLAPQFVDAVRASRKRCSEKARDAIRRRVDRWLKDAGADRLIDNVLAKWSEAGSPVQSLCGYLASFGGQLSDPDEVVSPVPPRSQLGVEIDSLIQQQAQKVFEFGTRQQIMARVEEEVDHELRKAWKLEFGLLAATMRRRVSAMSDRAAELARQCERHLAQLARRHAARATVARNGHEQLNLYSLDDQTLQDVEMGHQFDSILKGLALGLVKDDAPQKGYAGAVEDLLRRSPDVRRGLWETFDEYFARYEQESLGDGEKSPSGKKLRARLSQLKANASPRWLLYPDQPVERVSCLVHPQSLPLDGLAKQFSDDDLETIADPDYDEVVIVDIQHGAAVSDLLNLGLYEDAFEETLERRRRIAERSGRTTFHESELWLDRQWKVSRPARRGYRPQQATADRPALTFGLLFTAEKGTKIRTDTGLGFVIDDPVTGTPEQILGDNLSEAFAAWASEKCVDRMEQEYARLMNLGTTDLMGLGRRALDLCAAQLAAEGKLDEHSRDVLRRIEDAVRTQLANWEENQALDSAARPSAGPQAPAGTEAPRPQKDQVP